VVVALEAQVVALEDLLEVDHAHFVEVVLLVLHDDVTPELHRVHLVAHLLRHLVLQVQPLLLLEQPQFLHGLVEGFVARALRSQMELVGAARVDRKEEVAFEVVALLDEPFVSVGPIRRLGLQHDVAVFEVDGQSNAVVCLDLRIAIPLVFEVS